MTLDRGFLYLPNFVHFVDHTQLDNLQFPNRPAIRPTSVNSSRARWAFDPLARPLPDPIDHRWRSRYSMPRQSRPPLSTRETKTPTPKKRKRVIESSPPSSDSNILTAPRTILTAPNGSKRPKQRDTSPPSYAIAFKRMYNFSSPARPADVAGPSPPRRLPKASIVNPRHGAKLIKVKNQRKGQADLQAGIYYQQVLDQLVPSLDAILRSEKDLPTSNEELYQGVRIVCMQGKSAELYAAFSSRMRQHASETARSRIRTQLATTAPLPCVLEEWRLWKSQWVRRLPIRFWLMSLGENNTHIPKLDNPS